MRRPVPRLDFVLTVLAALVFLLLYQQVLRGQVRASKRRPRPAHRQSIVRRSIIGAPQAAGAGGLGEGGGNDGGRTSVSDHVEGGGGHRSLTRGLSRSRSRDRSRRSSLAHGASQGMCARGQWLEILSDGGVFVAFPPFVLFVPCCQSRPKSLHRHV
jgi:hypothetical protein